MIDSGAEDKKKPLSDQKISKLLEEICKNLTKNYLPEIIIYSLQCINYILDINPTLSYVLNLKLSLPI